MLQMFGSQRGTQQHINNVLKLTLITSPLRPFSFSSIAFLVWLLGGWISDVCLLPKFLSPGQESLKVGPYTACT